MLPRSFYEALPYINLVIGSVVIYRYDSVLLLLSGIMFFAAGAFMWSLRSDNRRKDQTFKITDYGSFNRNWYEFKPFFYMLFGLLTVTRSGSSILEMLGMLIGLFGLYLIVQRSLHRQLTLSAKAQIRRREAQMSSLVEVSEPESIDEDPEQSGSKSNAGSS
jgi:hypothetical protein